MTTAGRWRRKISLIALIPHNSPSKPQKSSLNEEIIIGQERAVRAIDFGLAIQDRGYNIYLSGAPGTGKNAIIKSMIARVAEKEPTPDDCCFVSNFQDSERPKALILPAGRGREFQRNVDQLVPFLKGEFKKAFQSKEYEEERLLGEIINSAKREKADLIVLGAHGRSGADHLFTECVAEKVVESAPCPVVTVRSQPAHSKRKPAKTDLE